jgi:hypothetical protein
MMKMRIMTVGRLRLHFRERQLLGIDLQVPKDHLRVDHATQRDVAVVEDRADIGAGAVVDLKQDLAVDGGPDFAVLLDDLCLVPFVGRKGRGGAPVPLKNLARSSLKRFHSKLKFASATSRGVSKSLRNA